MTKCSWLILHPNMSNKKLKIKNLEQTYHKKIQHKQNQYLYSSIHSICLQYYHLINSMTKTNFVEIMQQFSDQSQSKKLYKKAEGLYLMRSFKITNVSCSQAISSYQRLLNKYETEELTIQANDWHKNQRKLFIWFLICYCEQTKVTIQDLNDQDWESIAEMFFHKSPLFLKFQGLSILKNTKRHIWTEDDDALLKKYVGQINSKEWNLISKSIFFQKDSGKFISAKQCRQRWFNHICQEVNKQDWSHEEDIKILKFTLQIGKKWSLIARKLMTNRTEHMVKNRFNSIINKIRRKKIENQQSLTRKALQLYQKQCAGGQIENQDKQDQESIKSKSKQIKIPDPLPSLPSFSSFVKKTSQVKDNQGQQYNVGDLPQGDLKDLKPLVNKREKGFITFNADDTFQGGQGAEGIVLSMTPSSVKAISPGFTNYFCNFENFMNFDKQRRDDGSSLFSPACFSPAANFQLNYSPMDMYAFIERQHPKEEKTTRQPNKHMLFKKQSKQQE